MHLQCTYLALVVKRFFRSHAETLLAMRVVGLFGIGAFVMAMAGLYGVMAFLVAGRTREIGIRMALGADRARIGRFVMGSSLRLVVAGAAIGIAAAVLVLRAIASQLFGVTPTDPATYVTVAVATIVTASLATWQPARRAARVDPVQTLRAE
jgi:ABC-type antimicrobial peptide transport system permease subunit